MVHDLLRSRFQYPVIPQSTNFRTKFHSKFHSRSPLSLSSPSPPKGGRNRTPRNPRCVPSKRGLVSINTRVSSNCRGRLCRQISACVPHREEQVCGSRHTRACLVHVRAPFHDSTRVRVPGQGVRARPRKSTYMPFYLCTRVRVCVCARARYTAVSCTLEHGNAAPPRGTRDGRSGDTESEPQAGLRASPLPLARHTLIRSHSLPFVSVAPKPPVSFPPSSPTDPFFLLPPSPPPPPREHPRLPPPSPLFTPTSTDLPLSLSLSLPIVRSSLGCTSSAADRSSPPRCTPGGYARGARTDLSNPHGLPRCATFAAGLCKGGMYVRVGAHSYERGEIFRLCADCLSRERRYTRSYTCRAVGMLDIRGGGPLAYIFTIGFIERALVNGGHVVHSHLGEGISSSRRTTSVQRGNTACRKKQVQFSSRPLFPPSSRLMRAVTQEGRRV